MKLSVHTPLLIVAVIATQTPRAPLVAEDRVEIFDTEKGREPFLSPEAAATTFSMPEGFSVSVFAAEPHLRQPIAMTFDSRGRLWVAENYTYAEQAVNFETRLDDRIVIFDDIDGDGRFDQRTVFWDRAKKLTSIEIGFGGVWAACAPELLFIPDRDGDDVPDGEPVVLLDGWDDDRVRHNIVNGLRWGPDGWLYGRHGILDTSYVGPPGAPRDRRTALNCAIWRFHPTRHVFEVVAHGTTNSWGHDWDEHGQLFFINTVIGHLWHVVPGAHYERMYGFDFNPDVYELIPQTADHYHWDRAEQWQDVRKGLSEASSKFGGGHAHSGFMIYLGDNWPDEYRGDAFAVNYHGRRLNRDALARKGATYVGTHRGDPVRVGDVWFRGVEVISGPRGGVFVSDWSDVGECHDSDGVHRSSGRIYRIVHEATSKKSAVSRVDITALSDAELVERQLSRNDWHVRQARRVLQERAHRGDDMSAVHASLRAMQGDHADETRKLRALWCLEVTGGADDDLLLGLLDAKGEHMRVWAVKLLSERERISDAVVERFAKLAESDTSGLVLTFLASALQRLGHERRWAIADGLARHGQFADDPVFPRMLWYGIEPAVPRQPERAVALARASALPSVRRFVARRLTQDIVEEPASVDALLGSLLDAPSRDSKRNVAAATDVLRGMSRALRGWQSAPAPGSWPAVAEWLGSRNDRAAKLVRELSVVFGDGRAIGELRRLVSSGSAPVEVRRQAIRSLAAKGDEESLPALLKLIDDRDLGADAVKGLSAFPNPGIGRELLDGFVRRDARGKRLRAEVLEAIVEALTIRASWARLLLARVVSGDVEQEAITPFQQRRLRSLGDVEIAGTVDELWPRRDINDEARRELDRLRELLTPERVAAGDPESGRRLFTEKCSRCHRLFGEGGDAGPDLTGADRGNLEYLLSNTLDPSREVAESYRMSTVIFKDGRTLQGVLGVATGRMRPLRTPDELLSIDRGRIRAIVPSELSLMPEGTLAGLSDGELSGLFRYLMAGKLRSE